MPVFHLTDHTIEHLPETSFSDRGLKERDDLQRLLCANISVIADDLIVVAEEFTEWDESRRRIDLLAVDRNGNLVVVELKRDNEGAHMELQAIRYAAMVSSMTFDRVVQVFQRHLDGGGPGQNAEAVLLEFFGWDEPREEEFGRDVRIMLVSAGFSKELTTAVLWLNERDLDIRCVRIKPYLLESQIVVDVQQVVPLPEAEEYQVRVREKATSRRESMRQGGEATGYWFMNVGDQNGTDRSWEDCRTYSFMIAGGGHSWIDQIRKLKAGDRFFAYASGSGFVGLGEVLAQAVPYKDFIPPGQNKRLVDLPLVAQKQLGRMDDPDRCDWCAAVRWIETRARREGVLKNRALRNTVARIKQSDLVAALLREFGLSVDHT